MERTVNLEEILKQYLTVETMRANNPDYTFNMVLSAMKESCRQVLTLAAENAELTYTENFGDVQDEIVTSQQFSGDSEYGYNYINKESITNTINQVV